MEKAVPASGGCNWKWVRSCRLKPAFRPQWNAGFSRLLAELVNGSTQGRRSGLNGTLALAGSLAPRTHI
jgi:hypothetical protein